MDGIKNELRSEVPNRKHDALNFGGLTAAQMPVPAKEIGVDTHNSEPLHKDRNAGGKRSPIVR